MRIGFTLNAGGAAHQRESLRLAILARAAELLGHTVVEVMESLSGPSKLSLRPMGFQTGSSGLDLYVCPHRVVLEKRMPLECPTVAVKTIMRCSSDQEVAAGCDLVVAIVYDDRCIHPGSPKKTVGATRCLIRDKLLPVPWMPSMAVMEHFRRSGLLEAFVDDDLNAIRIWHRGKLPKTIAAGFVGSGHQWRRELGIPKRDWISVQWTKSSYSKVENNVRHEPADYLMMVGDHKVFLGLPGDMWGCYHLAESVVMGCAVAGVRDAFLEYDPSFHDAVVLLDDWSDEDSLAVGVERWREKQEAIEAAYREGWSPKGIVRRIVNRMGG